jgi:NAD(P)-dependent dehydrogenase (short-subunit alcohol dehydrogenase family)
MVSNTIAESLFNTFSIHRLNLMQRSILVTGASTGIGLAAARALKIRGWRVLATARKPADIDRLATQEKLEVIPLELTDETSIAACAEDALRRTDGKLGALYNNAAYGVVGAMEDISAQVLRQHFEANVIGTHELTRRIIPAMRKAGSGRIVLGFVSGPYRGAYCASKYALEALADAMRVELWGTGIKVSLIEPGPIETQFLPTTLVNFRRDIDMANSPHRVAYEKRLAIMEKGQPSFFRLGPEAVAAKIVHAVESTYPRIRYRVTFPTHMAALLKRVLPSRVLDQIVARW